jgi:hypothetical protein
MGSSLTLSFPEALFFEVFDRPGVEGDVLGYKISSP